MIRDILVSLDLDAKSDPGAEFALSAAQTFSAHLTGCAFGLEPDINISFYPAIPADFSETARAEARKAAEAAARRFAERARLLSVPAETRTEVTTVDGAAVTFGRLARLFDLAIVTQPDPDRTDTRGALLESALFDSGRPLLVVPYVQKAPLKLDRVLVAWDGGRAATRAVAEAGPFLERAKRVEVVVVESGKVDPADLPGADLAKHLARHGLKVELRRIVQSAGQDVAATLQNEVFENGFDFLVMGGYGHSRLREFILGGTTRSIVESMTAPVLMAH
jgi:nucleotide-binding universal stress UspA family protein